MTKKTYTELASTLGVSRSFLSNVVHGRTRMNVELEQKLADLVNWPASFFRSSDTLDDLFLKEFSKADSRNILLVRKISKTLEKLDHDDIVTLLDFGVKFKFQG